MRAEIGTSQPRAVAVARSTTVTAVRVVVAPDKFSGTLTASQAAAAIARGWARTAPNDHIDQIPVSDGGPGFVDAMHGALGGRLHAVSVTGPLGERTPAELLIVGDTAYLESASACGLHLVPADRRDPTVTTTLGVGELLLAAIDAGARRVVIGLGGSGTNDAGAGLLAALGADATSESGVVASEVLRGGGLGLRAISAVDLTRARARLSDI